MQSCSTQAFYAIGELACFTLPDGTMLPGLAPVALQQGKHVARNIEAALAGRSKEPFHSVDKGIMAMVGRASGIAQAGALKLSGMLGWLAWLFIHILFLIGFRNRLLLMFQWAWAWFAALDGKLTSNELNDDANAFARRYYASGEYFADFCEVCVRGNTVDESDAA